MEPSRPSRLGVPPATNGAEHAKAKDHRESHAPGAEDGWRVLDVPRCSITRGTHGHVFVRRVFVGQPVQTRGKQEPETRTPRTLGMWSRGRELATVLVRTRTNPCQRRASAVVWTAVFAAGERPWRPLTSRPV
jgi:hypothetical protein